MSVSRVEGQLGIDNCPITLAFSSKRCTGPMITFATHFLYWRHQVPATSGYVSVICAASNGLYSCAS
jgi:hypothetical protein